MVLHVLVCKPCPITMSVCYQVFGDLILLPEICVTLGQFTILLKFLFSSPVQQKLLISQISSGVLEDELTLKSVAREV